MEKCFKFEQTAELSSFCSGFGQKGIDEREENVYY